MRLHTVLKLLWLSVTPTVDESRSIKLKQQLPVTLSTTPADLQQSQHNSPNKTPIDLLKNSDSFMVLNVVFYFLNLIFKFIYYYYFFFFLCVDGLVYFICITAKDHVQCRGNTHLKWSYYSTILNRVQSLFNINVAEQAVIYVSHFGDFVY